MPSLCAGQRGVRDAYGAAKLLNAHLTDALYEKAGQSLLDRIADQKLRALGFNRILVLPVR